MARFGKPALQRQRESTGIRAPAISRISLAVGAAEVGAGAAAFCLAEFGFLALVFGEFFFGIRRIRVARGEHGIGVAGFLFLLSKTAELAADLTKGDVAAFVFPHN